jgi:hypothetical protein
MRLSTLAFLGLSLLGAGCTKPSEEIVAPGGNSTVQETRKPGSFRMLELRTGSELTVKRDETYYVRVSGPSDAVAALHTRIDGDQLMLEYDASYTAPVTDKLKLEVHTPFLKSVSLRGNGKATVEAGFEDSLLGSVFGSGSLRVLGGPFSFLSFIVSGSGSVDAHEAQCNEANVEVNGTGSIEVKASTTLTARIEGTGTISYYGSPTVTVNGGGAQGLIQKGQRMSILTEVAAQ